jgi:hypothetical protein
MEIMVNEKLNFLSMDGVIWGGRGDKFLVREGERF